MRCLSQWLMTVTRRESFGRTTGLCILPCAPDIRETRRVCGSRTTGSPQGRAWLKVHELWIQLSLGHRHRGGGNCGELPFLQVRCGGGVCTRCGQWGGQPDVGCVRRQRRPGESQGCPHPEPCIGGRHQQLVHIFHGCDSTWRSVAPGLHLDAIGQLADLVEDRTALSKQRVDLPFGVHDRRVVAVAELRADLGQ